MVLIYGIGKDSLEGKGEAWVEEGKEVAGGEDRSAHA